MTRKHFVAVAAIVKGNRIPKGDARTPEDATAITAANTTLDIVAMQLADVFKADNRNFDRNRFLAACGNE